MSSTTRKRPDRYARLLKRLRDLEDENAALRSRIKTLEERPPFVIPLPLPMAPLPTQPWMPTPFLTGKWDDLAVTCGGGQ